MHVHNDIESLHTATYQENKTNNNKHVICQLYKCAVTKRIEI